MINGHPEQGWSGAGSREPGGVGVHSHLTVTSPTKLMCFRWKYQKSLKKIAEYPLHQLTRPYRLEIHVIHIALSNINMDVRILFQDHFVVIVSSSLLWTGH